MLRSFYITTLRYIPNNKQQIWMPGLYMYVCIYIYIHRDWSHVFFCISKVFKTCPSHSAMIQSFQLSCWDYLFLAHKRQLALPTCHWCTWDSTICLEVCIPKKPINYIFLYGIERPYLDVVSTKIERDIYIYIIL